MVAFVVREKELAGLYKKNKAGRRRGQLHTRLKGAAFFSVVVTPLAVLVARRGPADRQKEINVSPPVQIAPYTFAFYYLGCVSRPPRERLRFYDSSLVISGLKQTNWRAEARMRCRQITTSLPLLSNWIINFSTCNLQLSGSDSGFWSKWTYATGAFLESSRLHKSFLAYYGSRNPLINYFNIFKATAFEIWKISLILSMQWKN